MSRPAPHSASYSICIWLLSQGWSSWGMQLNTDLHLVPRFRMNGATSPLLLHTLVECIGYVFTTQHNTQPQTAGWHPTASTLKYVFVMYYKVHIWSIYSLQMCLCCPHWYSIYKRKTDRQAKGTVRSVHFACRNHEYSYCQRIVQPPQQTRVIPCTFIHHTSVNVIRQVLPSFQQ